MVTAHKIIKNPNLTLALNGQKSLGCLLTEQEQTYNQHAIKGEKTHKNGLSLKVQGIVKNGEQLKQQKRKTNTDLFQMDHQRQKMQ